VESNENLSIKRIAVFLGESALAGLALGGVIEGARRLTEQYNISRLPAVLTTAVIIQAGLNKLAKTLNR